MIFIQWKVCMGSGAVFFLFLIYCAFSAYHINADRKADDPEIKDFAPLSPWLTPATPVIWLIRTIVLLPWTIPFGIFLILFPFMLILFRPIPENDPLKRIVIKIGNGVLKLNTKLLTALGLYTKPIRFQVE
jgi:hypothetical protein